MCHYIIDFKHFYRHNVYVQMTFIAKNDMPILWLPTWIAGSYLIREFAKNIDCVLYQTDSQTLNNKPIRAQKINKNSWQIHAKKGQTVAVSYHVYCFDLSVRTAYIDSERIFGNLSSLLLLDDTADNLSACVIDLIIPNEFFNNQLNTSKDHKIAIGLPTETHQDDKQKRYRLTKLPNNQPLTAFEAMDYPFEIGRQDSFEFYVTHNNTPVLHRFFVSGIYSYDKDRLCTDLTKICQAYIDWLDWLPFDNYTFMTHASENDYGGLEHINSTALITPRDDLPINEKDEPSDNYQRFLALCSHEYFHAWWVKSVRPDVMMTANLTSEAYTPLLWVFEGFTSYVDDFLLYQAKVISCDSYLNLLASQITRLLNNKGRAYQSVAESSFDAWIKLYRPDENSPNSTTSYYNKGALVALGLDLLLIKHNARLFDVIKTFVNKAKNTKNHRFGMSDDNLDEVMNMFLPSDIWQNFKQKYINDTTELPIQTWLNEVSIQADIHKTRLPFGLHTQPSEHGLIIKNITDNTSGLCVKDTIIAINGLKANQKLLSKLMHQTVTVHVFRRDVLMCFELSPQIIYSYSVSLTKSKPSVWLDFDI